MSLTSPKLWVVATPLGNPGDLSPRAREVLEGADMVLAEDTRRAGLLCQRCGVKAKRFMSFHDHNEESKLDEVLGLLNGGRTLALISDAGLPLVADPGYRLVRACRAAGIPVSVVPGPSAPVTALAGSGIAPQPTFLPRRRRAEQPTSGEGLDLTPKEKRWAALGAMKAVLVIAGAYLLGLGALLALLFLLWH